MRLEQAADLRRADAALEAADDLAAGHDDQRWNRRDAEPFRELRPLVHIDHRYTQAPALLPRKVRDQRVHAPRRPGLLGPKEDEQRLTPGSHL